MKVKIAKTCGCWVLGVVVFVSLVAYTLREADIPSYPEDDMYNPDFSLTNVTFSQLELADTSWELFSEYAELDKGSGVAELTNIQGVFFQNNDPVLRLVSPSASLTMADSDMIMSDAFATMTIDSRPVSLNASLLTWTAGEQLFEGHGDVMIESGSVTLIGEYFKVDLVARTLDVSQNSRVEILETDGL